MNISYAKLSPEREAFIEEAVRLYFEVHPEELPQKRITEEHSVNTELIPSLRDSQRAVWSSRKPRKSTKVL